MPTNIIIQ